MLSAITVASIMSSAATALVFSLLSAAERASERERMFQMMSDLRGHCKVCKHYEVWNYLKGDGMCDGCIHRPGGDRIADRWEWRFDDE